MTNTEKIINELFVKMNHLEPNKYLFLVEEQWPLLDDSKYSIGMADLIAHHVMWAYGNKKDFINMQRWFEEIYKHDKNKEYSNYFKNYKKGEAYLRVGFKEEALECFLLVHDEEPSYIKDHGVTINVFFSYYLEHGKIPTNEYIESETNKILGISEDDDDLLELTEWNAFFSESSPLFYEIIKKNGEFGERLTKQHNLALDYLIDNQKMLLEIILDGIFAYYSKEKPLYQAQGIDMPKVDSVQDLANLLMLAHFNFISVYNQGVPYIGFSFHCQWEIEHGLGVLMHKNRIVKIGHAEVSFDVELAKEDLKLTKCPPK